MDRLLRTPQADRATEDHSAAHLTLPAGAVIDVSAVEHAGAYRLNVSFSDGVRRLVDFETFLRSSANPLIRVYLDPARFANFRIEHGDLVWDDYGLCFSIADLYESRI